MMERSPFRRLDDVPETPHEARVAAYVCVRNEIDRLPYFLRYHRKLGVERFVFVDNASSDGSTEYLLAQQDCNVFWTAQSYSASRCGVDWINGLLDSLAIDRWSLILDADELLVYPRCEYIGLAKLVEYLEAEGAQALLTFLLDMYGAGPIRQARYTAGQPFLDLCPYFDRDSYEMGKSGLHAGVPVRGGARKRLFWADRAHRGNPPFLAKLPLVKWRSGLRYEASTHIIRGLRSASVTGALLHFKLFADLYDKARIEAQRGEHWEDAAQYEAYWSVLRDNPDLDPVYPGSVEYRDSMQLVELGLAHDLR